MGVNLITSNAKFSGLSDSEAPLERWVRHLSLL